MSNSTPAPKVKRPPLESRVRGLARRRGYTVSKSREWKHVPHANNHGEYMLANDRNFVVLGDRFNATLEDIEGFLKEEAAR